MEDINDMPLFPRWLTFPIEEAPSFFTCYPIERLCAYEAPKSQRRAEQRSFI